MKRAEWTRSFWCKAIAFTLAACCAPVIALCAATLFCAYENGWWTGEGDLYRADFVRGAVYSRMALAQDYYGNFGTEITGESYFTDPKLTNYRFALYDAQGTPLYDGISADGVALGIQAPLSYEKDLGRIESGVARELEAQDSIFWALWAARGMYRFRAAAIPVLAAALLLGLLAAIYLARVAALRPGAEGPVPGWQERIPFDLYLAAVGLALLGLAALAAESLRGDMMRVLPLYLTLALALLLCAAALALALWMTLCARVRLGKWWRNTVAFWLLRWGARLLRAAGSGFAAVLRSVPLVWKTALALTGEAFLEFLVFCNSGMQERHFFLWLLLRLLLTAALVWAAAQLRWLQAGGRALAAGDLTAKVDTGRLVWDFKRHGEDLNDISRGMQRAVDRQLKSERLKTELITNVSHDIKTPLTSLINYVDLLRGTEEPEKRAEYLEVLDRQSRRLKKLTEDLVEASKASSGAMAVNLSRRSVNELLSQALGEYSDRLAAAALEPVLTLPERELSVRADGALLWRVLDNLFANACKYALPGTRFYIGAAAEGDRVRLSFKNVSRDRLNISADELLERFVRGDASRSGEGSGLGLNIARSLTELQQGTFALSVDGDLFRVDVTLPAAE